MSIHLWEPIAEPGERSPACHCSVIQELENGDLLVGYYAGSGEARPDTAYVVTRRRAGAGGFDSLQVVANTRGKPEGNGILFQNRSGVVLLIYGTMHGRLDGPAGPGVRWRTCDLRMKQSADSGETWSPAERTPLPSPFAALDTVRLSDGRIALAWNRNPEARNPLTLALSEDEGRTWPHVRDLVRGEGQFHYPALIQTRDGLLHLTFTNNRRTIDHLVLTPDWIEGRGDDLPSWEGTGRRL